MKTSLLTVLIAAAASCWLAAPAHAFVPHVGDRAADLSGRDVSTKDLFSLSQHRGQWVFVDFWATT